MTGNRFAPDLRKRKLRNRRPSHATVVAYLALFVALSGTAMAVDGPLAGQNTVGSEDIINSEVRTGDIGDAEVSGNDLAPDSVGSGKIVDRQVKNADLGLGASSSNTIADGGIQGIDVRNDTLTGAHVANNSLPGADLTDNSVTSAKIADTSVTAADLAPVESPLEPELGNCVGSTSWTAAPAQAEVPAFWKDPFGVVHLEGAVGCSGNADEGTVIFNFPPGFRPPVFSVLRYGALGGGQTLVQLATTSDGGGARLVYDGPDGDAVDNYISLDGITFRTGG